jgi:S-adenosylmethionine-dependent methyltransferase
MEKLLASIEKERFESGAAEYAAYLETPEGRLRLDLAFANLQEFLPRGMQPGCALDIGCGTGANALRLAQLGFHVTLLDSSSAMLDIAKRAVQQAGITDKIETKQGDADRITNLFREEKFDIILCHNILEFVEEPGAVLRAAASVLRNSSSIISVLVRNRAGEVLKAALMAGDLKAAENNLTAEWGQESLYKGRVRIFTPERLQEQFKGASLEVLADRGVRILSDYLPEKISRTDEYERIFELERKLGSRSEFAAVARYTHCLAHRVAPMMKDAA